MLPKNYKIILFQVVVVLISSCELSYLMEENSRLKPVGFSKYEPVYMLFNDQIKGWEEDSLCVAKSLLNKEWMLDSLMLFTADSNLCLGFISKQGSDLSVLDYLHEVVGYKTNNGWILLRSSNSFVLNRGTYKSKIYEPMTLDRISMLGRENLLKNKIINPDDEELRDNILKMVGCSGGSSSCVNDTVIDMIKRMNECKYIIDKEEEKRQLERFLKTRPRMVNETSFFDKKKRFD